MDKILPFPEALAEVLRHAAALSPRMATELTPLLQAAGRTLAEPVRAERDQPPFARSTRDGFAVRSNDLGRGTALRVLGRVRAGESWDGPALSSGEAIEIMTGAPLPEGANCVLMVEHVRLDDDLLQPEAGRTLRAGENVVPQGAEARAGGVVVPPGRQVGAAEIALAAACGSAQLEVNARPHVAIVATGDELVELVELAGVAEPAELTRPGGAKERGPRELAPAQIRNSNSYALAALVAGEGAKPQRLPIARDTTEDLGARVETGRTYDLILFSGGVSMGKYDLVEPVLAEAGAEFFFTGALIQPGKPVVFGRLPKNRKQETGDRRQEDREDREDRGNQEWTYFLGLPGNPVSTEVCFRLFVAPLLRALAGQTGVAPRFSEARLAEAVQGGSKVTRFLPAEVSGDWQGVYVRVVPWQGSGDLAANARAHGFVVLPAGVTEFAAGETVRVLLR